MSVYDRRDLRDGEHEPIPGHERRGSHKLRRGGEDRDATEKNETEKEEDADERELLPHRRGVERLRPRPVLGRLVLITRSHLSDQRSNAALSGAHSAAHEGTLVRRQKLEDVRRLLPDPRAARGGERHRY